MTNGITKVITKVIDGWTLGGSSAGPSLPGPKLQRMIGSRISVNMYDHTLLVPTPEGKTVAEPGDYIALYEDGTLEVRKGGIDGQKKKPAFRF